MDVAIIVATTCVAFARFSHLPLLRWQHFLAAQGEPNVNSESWLARAGRRYSSITVIWLVAALLIVGDRVDSGRDWEAVWAGAVALIIHTAYVVMVRNHLTEPWRTVERNALRLGVVLGLVALSVTLVDMRPPWFGSRNFEGFQVSRDIGRAYMYVITHISNGIGVALSLAAAGIVSRFVLLQLPNSKAERLSRSQGHSE